MSYFIVWEQNLRLADSHCEQAACCKKKVCNRLNDNRSREFWFDWPYLA